MSEQQITPVADDLHATPDDLLARAAVDLTHATQVTDAHDAQGGTGEREGVLPGGDS
ncbi:hypothetical protein ACGFY7_23485 [Streptomyces prunicolor]|uniref:hypothetical protein n=1 Tax=Streptomyces prunicolor TaxID=67348 RepID=UPI003715C931